MNKIIGLGFILLIFQYSANSQSKEGGNIKTALLIVDIQNFYFPGPGPGLPNAEQASLNAKEVLSIFRERNQLIVHIRHQSKNGFDIHQNVAPISNEKVITKVEINSFQHTDLLEYLKANQVNRLVITGMQTQMCVEAAIRAGKDLGFECFVIQDACAAKDQKFNGRIVKAEDVHASVLATIADGGYAKVLDLNTFKENADKYLHQKLE